MFRNTDPRGIPLGKQATKTDLVDIARALGAVISDRDTVPAVRAAIRARLDVIGPLLSGIERVCARGGDVFVAAGDRLNVDFGMQGLVTLPDGSAKGAEFRAGGDTAVEALVATLERAGF